METEPQPKPESSFIERVRTMDKRLRLMVIATLLLLIPGIGQFIALHDLATTKQLSPLALLFAFSALAIIPTSLILTGAILYLIRRHWGRHEKLAILGLLNLLLVVNLTWFFVHACSWGMVFGVNLTACR